MGFWLTAAFCHPLIFKYIFALAHDFFIIIEKQERTYAPALYYAKITPVYLPPYRFAVASAPFHQRKPVPLVVREYLRRYFHKLIARLKRHKHTDNAVGRGRNGQRNASRVILGVEGYHVVGTLLQLGQPVDDKFVRFSRGKPYLKQLFAQERR